MEPSKAKAKPPSPSRRSASSPAKTSGKTLSLAEAVAQQKTSKAPTPPALASSAPPQIQAPSAADVPEPPRSLPAMRSPAQPVAEPPATSGKAKRGLKEVVVAKEAAPTIPAVPEDDGLAKLQVTDPSRLSDMTQRMKPKLKVSESGRFEDQFYHAHDGSKAMARLRKRAYQNKTVHMSGNDVEQFSDADIITSGYLVKQGSFWKSWRRRFFILRRDRPVLCYYTSAEELAKLGEIAIDENTRVQPTPKDGFPFRFTIENEGRKLTLFAEQGEESMEAWISCISGCITQRARSTSRATMNGSFDRRSEGGSFRTQLQARVSESTPMLDELNVDRTSFSRMESPHIASGMNTMKRFSTDTTVIQQAANDSRSVRENEEKQKQQLQQSRQHRNSRLTSIASAPLDSARAKPRLFRSSSAGSILTQSSSFSVAPRAYDDNGLSMMHSPSHSASDLQVAQIPSNSPRAPSLSLPGFKPQPSVELAVSVGSKAVQDVPQMLVVLFSIRQGQRPEEISRTEIRSSLSLRSCGGDFYARDFNALLSVPRTARSMLQLEVFSVVNPASEALENQKSLGFVRVSALDVLFSRESSMLLECHRTDASKQLYYLILDRFLPPSHSINVSHAYTYAKHHFLVDTQAMEKRKSGDLMSSSTMSLRGGLSYSEMLRGQMNSSTASHVLVSEELSTSYVSVSMTVAFLKYLQRRNVARIDEAKQVINDMRQHIQANSASSSRVQEVEDRMRDVELEMAHYMRLHALYQDNLKRYEMMFASLEDGREQGITGCLKRSNMKKDKATAFMATNLNCHLVRGRRVHLAGDVDRSEQVRRGSLTSTSLDDGSGSDDSDSETSPASEFVYSVVTHGCATAHIMGFKEGGLRRLQQQLASQSPSDPRLRERIEVREDVVRSQVLAIAGASFLNAVGLAATRGGQHRQRLQLACSTGYLLSIESLLSTVGAEKGMLEDMSEGVRWLNSVVSFQLVQSGEANPHMEMSKCVSVTSTPTGDHVVVAFAVPPDVFVKLPNVLQQGHAIKLHGVMFTQGINEMQSVANHYLNSSLQDELNFESVQMLQRYFRVYQTQVTASAGDDKKREADLAELAELQLEIEALTGRLNIRTENVQKKFVNILIASSDICRRLGAGRTTCCKSGKDRTAMSVTLETSRLLVDHFHVKQGVHLCNAMRERGVRRVNVLANTGKTKFAFNSFQLKYIPDCYKPPLACADSHVAS
ncbi:Phosphatidylinositol 3,4,5-trisphosphate-dependent Rac exchanger 2 protein [Phytophthora pseudosyringae]|uniref:Phosphatidylinositol 3,4,5-trisphosphate-dependent Rac exchanger 2 protein n=1 Tax=Phytophthora pseudosyringae TaxID=221518 RepID=A0A8T1W1T0_9STRA|nr:Phosphatidylinositol 3,4,5-trisphosphate-dependent Rac exchanger 2 protein [Phytophthora pseudosyringae]